MKRETMRHPKTFALMGFLGCTRPEALGYLTLLWDYTGDVAIQGDIGKWPNSVISRACDWPGDPDKFVVALTDSDWLDQVDGPSRLLIHDWPHHCQDWVRKKIQRSKLDFDPAYHRRDGESVFVLRSQTEDKKATPPAGQCPDSGGTVAGQCPTIAEPCPANGPTIPSKPVQSLPVPSKPIGKSAKSDTPDPLLLAWLAWWNDLRKADLVTHGVSMDPAKENIAAWKRAKKNPESMAALADPAAMRRQMEAQPFTKGPWLTLAKLLVGTNRDGELISVKILRGGFDDAHAKSGQIVVGPGQRFRDDDYGKEGTF